MRLQPDFKIYPMETSTLIDQTRQALETSADPTETFTLKTMLVELYRKNGNRSEAITLTQSLIRQILEGADPESNTIGALYNNLGLLLMNDDIPGAISAFREADRWYREDEKTNPEKIAGVNFHLSQLYTRIKDGYYTKKYLKESIAWFNLSQNGNVHEAHALAHNQLAQIYSDNLMLFDARNHFKKALELYSAMYTETKNPEIAMIIGGILNNLGGTYRDLESFFKAEEYFLKTLEFYEELESQSRGYLPWIGATLTNLSNLYAGYDKQEQAITFGLKAQKVYEHLSHTTPEKYTHYLATSFHNLGILHMDTDPEKAENFFSEAIQLRRVLANKEPRAFQADLAVSILNLVELYHTQWELQLNLELKNKALNLLNQVETKTEYLPLHLPSVQNMLNDLEYYKERLTDQDLSGLHFLKISREVMEWKKEVHSTILPGEKIPFQKKIVKALREHVMKFPGHERGKEAFSDALSEQAWYFLREGNLKKAALLLSEMRHLNFDMSPEAKSNLAHYHLLSGDTKKAIEFYKQVLPLKNEDQKPMRETLQKDLRTLEEDGVLPALPDALAYLLEDMG